MNDFKLMSMSPKAYITMVFLALAIALLVPSTALALSSPTIQYFGGSNWEVFNGVDNTHDGGYVVVGHSSSNNGNLEGLNKKYADAVIVKFSADAEVQWVKTFGGSFIDSFQSVKQTKDGGYIAVGSSSSVDMDMNNSRKKAREAGQDSSNDDAIIVKFNSLGEVEWFKDFGGSQRDSFNGVVETPEGDFIAVGESESKDGDLSGLALGNCDAIYARYNHDGTFMGAHSYGGSLGDGFNDLVLLSDGSIVAVGYSSSNDKDMKGAGASMLKGIVVKINKDLSIPWATSVDLADPSYQRLVYSSGNGFQDVKVTDDQGFIVVGKGTYIDQKADGNSNMNEDGRIYKFNSLGQEEWHDTYINQAYTRFFGVAQDQSGSYMVVGDSYMPEAKKIIALRYDPHGVRLWDKEDEGSRSRYLLSLVAKGDHFVAVGSKYIQGKSEEGLLYIGRFEEANNKLIMAPNTGSHSADTTAQLKVSETERLSGNDRYETAIAISKKGWEKSENVILVNGNNFPDALVGSSFAYLKNAPILITASDKLDNRVSAEIQRLGAKTIAILGNSSSVSQPIENQLKERYQVTRIGGAEIYDTAVKLGEEIKKIKPFDTVIIATQSNFPDALAIAPYSAKETIPILFTEKDRLRPDTKKALAEWEIRNAIIIGGTGVVSLDVDLELDALGLTITRLGGEDRYDTALEIAKQFGTENPYSAIAVATGENYPDALTGAVLAAKHNAPLILVRKNKVKNTVTEYLNPLGLEKATIFGGTGVVLDEIFRK
ncbi:cell wall-binding protein [Desulfitobacterium dehalogenans ATCC 51507]|uniref:Cell wall-binding protein n=1 Tax=Desulfitobacterium dehalogenans (strain ATCC 51507 / DSM 9161 / JW/IU-DC1) TaxID=756499 RepID=I4A8F5_DESDJ|nr:cell wall-binding repeat-containing protein [Desulfitobacterium dehalogenans]AFM00240.1 cell wall-binding protein [Desulfitobacterium dehalogenans ATCC 51507]